MDRTRSRSKTNGTKQNPMQFSVIIPTCHRNDLLAKCLDRLAPGQQAGAQIDWESRNVGTDIAKSGHGILVGESPDLAYFSYEVIVSDDGTRSTAERMVREKYPWAHWVAGPRRGPAANRNNGARNAVGEWLAFIDDDCIPDSGWLYNLHKCIGTGPWKVVEGMTTIPDRHDSPFLHAVENVTGGNYWSCNLAVERDVYNSLGGFSRRVSHRLFARMHLCFIPNADIRCGRIAKEFGT